MKRDKVLQTLMHDELMLLERTDHPHITRVFELMEDDLKYYVVMEYFEGGNLL
jgi:serine/threonine protein kinase